MITKEERFLELIKNYSIELSIDSFPFSFTIYNFEGVLIKMRIHYAIVSNSKIWSIFEKEYNMTESNIGIFINNMLLKYLNIKAQNSFSNIDFDSTLHR